MIFVEQIEGVTKCEFLLFEHRARASMKRTVNLPRERVIHKLNFPIWLISQFSPFWNTGCHL
jgi:hypothetical protein